MKHKANRINESTTTVSPVGAIHELPLQNDLPEGWVNTNLEDVVDILDRRRIPVNAEDRDKRRGTIPYYGATGQVGWIDDYLFDEELVLLGEDGAPFLEPTKQKAYIIRGKSWVNNHAHVLRARNGIPNAYIKYYLDIVDYHKFVSGTTRLKLNQSAMRQIPVPIAPPDQQRLIVAEIEKQFSRLDEAVAALKRIQANLKRYKASVLKAAVEGKLTEQWRKEHPDVEPTSELLKHIFAERRKKWEEENPRKKYVEPESPDKKELPELPYVWVWIRLEQITERITKGSSPNWQGFKYVEMGIPFVRSQNVLWGELDTTNIAHLPEEFNKKEAKSVLKIGDVLLNIVGASIGRSAIATREVEGGNVNQAVAMIRLIKNGLNNIILMNYLISSDTQEKFNKEKVDVARANLSLGDISELIVPMPPQEEQAQIIGRVEK
jgi:type I restriction enzyme S subunit